jgi:hypothetical protein
MKLFSLQGNLFVGIIVAYIADEVVYGFCNISLISGIILCSTKSAGKPLF